MVQREPRRRQRVVASSAFGLRDRLLLWAGVTAASSAALETVAKVLHFHDGLWQADYPGGGGWLYVAADAFKIADGFFWAAFNVLAVIGLVWRAHRRRMWMMAVSGWGISEVMSAVANVLRAVADHRFFTDPGTGAWIASEAANAVGYLVIFLGLLVGVSAFRTVRGVERMDPQRDGRLAVTTLFVLVGFVVFVVSDVLLVVSDHQSPLLNLGLVDPTLPDTLFLVADCLGLLGWVPVAVALFRSSRRGERSDGAVPQRDRVVAIGGAIALVGQVIAAYGVVADANPNEGFGGIASADWWLAASAIVYGLALMLAVAAFALSGRLSRSGSELAGAVPSSAQRA